MKRTLREDAGNSSTAELALTNNENNAKALRAGTLKIWVHVYRRSSSSTKQNVFFFSILTSKLSLKPLLLTFKN